MSLIHQIALTLIPSVGPVNARKLISHFKDALNIFQAGSSVLISETGMSAAMAAQICSPLPLQLAEEQLLLLGKYDCQPLFFTDPLYPQNLNQCHDAPLLLYSRGNARLEQDRIVSIVGSRKTSTYGLQSCAAIAEVLQDYDVMVVSGLAYGIDVCVHRECLRLNIPTVGVLGHGLDRIYPAVHREIAADMLNCGGLVSEFPFKTSCRPENFPRRNRIIAGIAAVTIVVEAAEKGGALITADLANSYHRDVYAVPGRITDLGSAGCNYLIRTNQAILLQHTAEVMEAMGWNKVHNRQQDALLAKENEKASKRKILLTAEQRTVFNALSEKALQADQLSAALKMGAGTLALTLLDLEMKGLICVKPGGLYQLSHYES